MATGVVRPNQSVDAIRISVCPAELETWEAVDDPVVAPAEPDTADYLQTDLASLPGHFAECEVGCTTLSNVSEVTAIRLWIYARKTGEGNGGICGSIGYVIGDDYNYPFFGPEFDTIGSDWGWHSRDITDLSLTPYQLEGLRLCFGPYGDVGVEYQVAAFYAEVTYTPLVIALHKANPVVIGAPFGGIVQ